MTIYTPTSLNHAKEIASLLSNSPQDCLRLHAAFGSHFGGDMAVTQANAYMLSGKPSLNADAMAGIVRRSGLCRYMIITSWDNEHCTYQCARHDEPESIVHTFTFTIEMAKAQGLTRNRNWQNMPMQMLRVRALTMMLRAVYPDAVSGIYSPDELADHMPMNDSERTRIVAQSIGEEVHDSNPPRPIPQQHQAIQDSVPPTEPTPQSIALEVYQVAMMGELDEATGEVSEHEWDNSDDVQQVLTRGRKVKTKTDLETFIIGTWVLATKPNNATPDAIDALHHLANKHGISDTKLGIF